MFRRITEPHPATLPTPTAPMERVTSVLGQGITWRGNLTGTGGVRIEGSFEGDINLRGLLVVGETGRVVSNNIRCNVVIIAGAVRSDITTEKLEIRATGRVWGNVITTAFTTEEGAFLRGQIRMEDEIELGRLPDAEAPEEATYPTQDVPYEG